MKFISCNSCGTVLDQDKLNFADDMYNDDDCIAEDVADYDGTRKGFYLYVPCPVCQEKVFKQ